MCFHGSGLCAAIETFKPATPHTRLIGVPKNRHHSCTTYYMHTFAHPIHTHTQHTQHTQHMLHLTLTRRTSVEEYSTCELKRLPTLLSFSCPCCGPNIPSASLHPPGWGHSRRQFGDVRIKGDPKQKTPLCISVSWNQNIDSLMFGAVGQLTLATNRRAD